MDPRFVSIDDRLVAVADAHLSVTDRGFQLGDAVFETLRARAGRPVELAAHVERLQHSLGVLEIELPGDVAALLESRIGRLLAAEGLAGPEGDAAIRVTISRGAVPGRGILPAGPSRPTVVIQAWRTEPPPARHLTNGLSVIVSSVRRDPANPLSGVKSTSRANSVFARLEARRAGADDAIFLTTDGYLSEATAANLFLVRSGELATPALGCAILAGTTRAWLLRWATGAGLRPVEGFLTTRDLAEAGEAFVSSSVAGVVPVTAFEGAAIGAGRPGPWTGRARAEREACFTGMAGADGGAQAGARAAPVGRTGSARPEPGPSS